MDAREKQIAPPKSWETFEDLCLALFKAVWRDPNAQKHGRRGQAQAGVDVFGSSGPLTTMRLPVGFIIKSRGDMSFS
jgi:hypothetical protein